MTMIRHKPLTLAIRVAIFGLNNPVVRSQVQRDREVLLHQMQELRKGAPA